MLVDPNLNITYLRSDRVTVDNVQPVIGGIENGKTYCEAQTVTIDEKYVNTVTVNGTEVTLDENNSFVLSPADGEQKIIVTDKAGNTAEMTVTVNDGIPAAQPPAPKGRFARFAERLTESLTRRTTPTWSISPQRRRQRLPGQYRVLVL